MSSTTTSSKDSATLSSPSSFKPGGTTSASSSSSSSSSSHYWTIGAVGLASLGAGFFLGRYTRRPEEEDHLRVLPAGLPRTCCDDEHHHHTAASLTKEQEALPAQLARIVGKENILDGQVETTQTLPFLKGARLGGGGKALAIVTPRLLEDVVKCIEKIVAADCVILPQGSNTGLTGGSVPRWRRHHDDHHDNEEDDDRPVVIISMKHLNAIVPIDHGKRVLCLGGAGLAQLHTTIAQNRPDRESHSILGSTFLNPTVAAGVALGSGGTQIRKGPAYTDRALYVRIDQNKWGEKIVSTQNTLGVVGLEDEDWNAYAKHTAKIGQNGVVQQLDHYWRDLEQGYSRAMAYSNPNSAAGQAKSSDAENYGKRLCSAPTSSSDASKKEVSRYNADCRGCDCNRSEGKVMILATVHDTFPKPTEVANFWLSFADLETALAFRQEVALASPTDLPMSMEYLDRDAFDVIDRSGRLLAFVIKMVGPFSPLVQSLWKIKLWLESLPFSGAPLWADQFLHMTNGLYPETLPARLMKIGREMDHHVALQIGEYEKHNSDDDDGEQQSAKEEDDGTLGRFLKRMKDFHERHGDKMIVNECKPNEVSALTAFRFVAAPAFRTWCVGEGVQGISVDYALPKYFSPSLMSNKSNSKDEPLLPIPNTSVLPLKRMRYSHFGCNVVHEDLAFGRDVTNVQEVKYQLKHAVEDECGGRLPAEHGHGTEYKAPPETQERWRRMDPLNVMNPGVGGLSYKYKYKK